MRDFAVILETPNAKNEHYYKIHWTYVHKMSTMILLQVISLVRQIQDAHLETLI
jgi:hypothetical protein